jgi:hypothetical protein
MAAWQKGKGRVRVAWTCKEERKGSSPYKGWPGNALEDHWDQRDDTKKSQKLKGMKDGKKESIGQAQRKEI